MKKIDFYPHTVMIAEMCAIFYVAYSSYVAFSVSSFFSTLVVSLGALFTYSEGKISLFYKLLETLSIAKAANLKLWISS